MPSGGARNRSGPPADPNSGRSDRRGFKLTALPSEGYEKWALKNDEEWEVPVFPLERPSDRELAIWREAWRTPQACAWSKQSWRWPVVAEYCRLKAVVEDGIGAMGRAALVAQLHRYRDQIGLTPAGLKENGWMIAADEVGEKRQAAKPVSSRSKLKVVASDGA